jgi:hypothetical protein
MLPGKAREGFIDFVKVGCIHAMLVQAYPLHERHLPARHRA